MKKIPSLFQRPHDDPERLVIDQVTPGCEWVLKGEGVATAKLDGSACAVINGILYKRYDNSRLKGRDTRVQRTAPLDDWIHCQDTNEKGKFIYWIPIKNKDYYHQIAWAWAQGDLSDGTYELVGPDVQDNPHKFLYNCLIKHGAIQISCKYDLSSYDAIRKFLEQDTDYEGIVWHHPDGRMAKITKKKFGIPWAHNKGKQCI